MTQTPKKMIDFSHLLRNEEKIADFAEKLFSFSDAQ
jgi:hypothetical protein